MQESTCNPSAVGGGGEQGMFQISQDKCGGAPGGNCQDVTYNMRTAMKYFADTVSGNGGDAFLSMGMYNGWSRGMTFDSATAARFGGCCRCQNNLDYLHQLTNAWMQGHNGNSFGEPANLQPPPSRSAISVEREADLNSFSSVLQVPTTTSESAKALCLLSSFPLVSSARLLPPSWSRSPSSLVLAHIAPAQRSPPFAISSFVRGRACRPPFRFVSRLLACSVTSFFGNLVLFPSALDGPPLFPYG